VTIELWDWLEHLNVLVGADFPEADEDALWRCSRAWSEAANEIRALVPFAASAGAAVHEALGDDSGDAFARFWGPFHADGGYLATLAEHCDKLAAACDRTASDVEYAKLEYIAALVVLASTLAALTASLIAGGVSALGMPAAIAFAQFSIRLIITRLISGILFGVALVGGMDVFAQLVQVLDGHRHEWDWSRTLRSVEDGAIFGGVGAAGFLGLGRLVSPTIGRAAGFGLMAGTAGATGLVGGTLAPLVHGERPSLEDIGKATLVSALGGLGAAHHGSNGHGGTADDVVVDAHTTAVVTDASPHLDGLRLPEAATHLDQPALPHDAVGAPRHEPANLDAALVASFDRAIDRPPTAADAVRPTDRPSAGPVLTTSDVRSVDPVGSRPAIPDPHRSVDTSTAPAARPSGGRAASAPATQDRPPEVPSLGTRSADTAPATPAGVDPAQAAAAPARADLAVVPAVAGAPPDLLAAGQHPPAVGVPGPHLIPPDGDTAAWAARGGVDPGGRGWLDPHTGDLDPGVTGPGSPGVRYLLDRARSAEPDLTAIVREVADRVGGTLVGLDERLKNPDSISDKLTRHLRAHPTDSLATGLAEINDTVRYTIVFPDETYSAGAQAAIDDLAGRLRPVRDRRSWDNSAGYLGVNSVWYHEGTGTTFEVQLHTPDSFAAKSVTHGLYKAIRVSNIDLPELQAEHDAAFTDVRVPDGAHTVGIPDSLPRHRPTLDLTDDVRSRSAEPSRSRAPDDFAGPDTPADSAIEDFRNLRPDPRHAVTDAEAAALVRQHVVDTDAGLAFYPVHDRMRDFARAMRPADGLLTIDLHGSRTGFEVEDGLITPEQLATALRELRATGRLDLPEGVGLKVVSCDTAFGGEHSPAARLARAFGVEVVAPDELVWTTIDGYDFVSSPRIVHGDVLVPMWPPDGAWHRFNASGREIPVGRDPSRLPASGKFPGGLFPQRDGSGLP
jgi:hypothetical protein